MIDSENKVITFISTIICLAIASTIIGVISAWLLNILWPIGAFSWFFATIRKNNTRLPNRYFVGSALIALLITDIVIGIIFGDEYTGRSQIWGIIQ